MRVVDILFGNSRSLSSRISRFDADRRRMGSRGCDGRNERHVAPSRIDVNLKRH